MNRATLKSLFPNCSQEFLEQNSAPNGQSEPRGALAGVVEPARATPESMTYSIKDTSDNDDKAIRFTIPLAPMGKPRMTQRDKWKKRPCVERYRAWMDSARPFIPKDLPENPSGLSWKAYFPLPKSYSQKKRDILSGTLHREKPDRDNIDKGVCDFLFKQDKGIAFGRLEKFWDDGRGPRIEIIVHP